jgi:hypothetical protein
MMPILSPKTLTRSPSFAGITEWDALMPSQILLPLRSNTAWFSGPDSRSDLEARMKWFLALYDVLVVQNGRYTLTLSSILYPLLYPLLYPPTPPSQTSQAFRPPFLFPGAPSGVI